MLVKVDDSAKKWSRCTYYTLLIEDDDVANFSKLGKSIQKETLTIPKQKELFNTLVTVGDTGQTLMTVLKCISSKFSPGSSYR